MNNQNSVELLGFYGSDETHALSAWCSTARELTDEKRARIPAMLTQLATAGHHTPFEKSSLHFLVTSDIASHIHILKHRIGVSVNAESARYKELKEDRTYIPADWPPYLQEMLLKHSEASNLCYHKAIEHLEASGVPRKRAKESARYFKTYNSQLQCDVMFNWRSFAHFLSLRADHHAQKEIQAIARSMLGAVAMIPGNPFRYTIAAFGYEKLAAELAGTYEHEL